MLLFCNTEISIQDTHPFKILSLEWYNHLLLLISFHVIIGFSGLIIGLSGAEAKVDIDEMINNGANNVFLKPINFNTLKESLYEWFK